MPGSLNSDKVLKVAVIGLGYFSQFHLDSWRRMQGVDLVAVCDLDASKRQKAEKDYNCRSYPELSELLSKETPDIVDLVIPPVAHAQAIEIAASAGRLLICQKPFGRDLEEARQMTELASAGNCDLVVHENFRFQPWYRVLKRMLETDELGEVLQARFSLRPGDGRGKDAYLARQPAFQKMEKFLIHETGVHFIDLHRWLFGEVESVFADLQQINPHLAGEDAGVVLFNHEGGARSMFDGNRNLDHAAEDLRRTMGEMEIEGTKATIRLAGDGTISKRGFKDTSWQLVPMNLEVDEDSFGGGCVHALNKHLVSNFESKQFENNAQRYLRIIEIEEAIYRSNLEGRKINLV